MRTNLTLIGIIALLIVIVYFSLDFGIKEKRNRKGLESFATARERQHANEANVWHLKYSDLERMANGQGKLISAYETRILQAYKDIEEYKKGGKNTIHYTSTSIISHDTIRLPAPAVCDRIAPLKTDHVNIDFIYNDSDQLIGIDHQYHARQSILITLSPKRKANGMKHFPNWGVLWGWDEISISTIDDEKAIIESHISVDFNK